MLYYFVVNRQADQEKTRHNPKKRKKHGQKRCFGDGKPCSEAIIIM